MCGICGLVAPHGAPDPAAVERMADAIRHRGPDDGGAAPLGRAVLGHRRLSVVDLDQGYQPVAGEDGSVTAVFNGEIYDFQALHDELEAKGHRLRGYGDTVLLPHLYEEHGPRFVERLHGMFALALWDAPRERLVLARDRIGKKPLLYTTLPDGTFAFASELKALLQLPQLRRAVDPEQLDAFLALQYVPGDRSALAGVRRLPPGHLLVLERGAAEPHVERYWRLLPEGGAAGGRGGRAGKAPSQADWLERVRDEVGAAVRRRLVADVPLGALLSGGLDSSIVVALAAQASSEPLRTFTVGFGDAAYDERDPARVVAERWGTQHEEIVVEPDAHALLPQLAWAFDEPHGDEAALPTLLVSALARQRVTVALGGDGGDEAFAGYERYVAMQLAGAVPSGLAGAGAAALRLHPAARGERRSPLFRAARLLDVAAAPRAERYGRLMEVFPAALRAELWEPGFVARPRPAHELLGAPPLPGTAGLQVLDAETYLPGDLLVKADIASMACSLELRSPFLDDRVLQLGVSLPDSLRGRRGKEALRRAFSPELPPSTGARAKTGFGVPLARWFREDLREVSRDLLLGERARSRGQLRPAAVERLLADHDAGRADHGHRIWCLLVLELWQRLYVESPAPPSSPEEAARVLR